MIQEQLKTAADELKSTQEADKLKISQMQTIEADLKSQLEASQTAYAANQNEVQKLTADMARLQQQLADKQACFDQLASDKQSSDTASLQKLSAQQSELEQLTSDKQLSAQAIVMKDTEIASPATLAFVDSLEFLLTIFCVQAYRPFC